MPWEFKSELAAIFEKLALSPDSIADPVKPSRSGPVPFWNLVIPIGISPSSAPAKMVSTPKLLAAVSESSTTIASTNTWALLISSLDIRFFIVAYLTKIFGMPALLFLQKNLLLSSSILGIAIILFSIYIF